jgi:hypothetical protein
MTDTRREAWIMEMVRMFAAGQLSGELIIRFRDGVPVEAVPSPRYKPPGAGRRVRETGA